MSIIGKVIKKFFDHIARKKNPVTYARKIGCQVGERCVFSSSVDFGSEPWLITIGNHVEITGNTCFITHDGAIWVMREHERYKNVLRYGRINIQDNVFIGWGSIIHS